MDNCRFTNTLIIGGTGMLAPAANWCIARSTRAIVIGRDRARLRPFERQCGVRVEALDYQDRPALDGVLKAFTESEPVNLALLWLHDPVRPVLETVMPYMDSSDRPARVVHVQSSAAAQPGRDAKQDASSFASKEIEVAEVILGFRVEGGGSRWLTHAEIAGGVIDALECPVTRRVIGTVTPWSRRP